MTSPTATLNALRDAAGPRATQGLSPDQLRPFLHTDPLLARAIAEAADAHPRFLATVGEQIHLPERELASWLQADFVNFYGPAALNPYIALAARGPWIVTTHGAVLHDSGGYGMLGFGHAPDAVLQAMSRPWVMANIMTPNGTHRRFTEALRQELGHTRGGCPFDRFLCMNSGSEAVTVATRIADIQAKRFTDPGGRHEGKTVKFLALSGGFHGRTDRPAQASSSSAATYRDNLRSFRDMDVLVTVPPNDIDALRAAFAQADADNVFFDLMLIEPVMGEGRPGLAMTRTYYDEARRLTQQAGTLLLVDSIQAGIRVQGVLSLVDYPGFQDAPPPDMETWSKALNAAQFPLSVLGLTQHAADLYVRGVYGNTMTANPRALEVGIATLDMLTDGMRSNIVTQGAYFRRRLEALAERHPQIITGVSGTGLLLAADLDPERYPVVGFGGVEEACRLVGIGVIHGGKNALRFTPHFAITPTEIDLVIQVLEGVLVAFQAPTAG